MFAAPELVVGSKWVDSKGGRYVVACVDFNTYVLLGMNDWNRYYDPSSLKELAKTMAADTETTFTPADF